MPFLFFLTAPTYLLATCLNCSEISPWKEQYQQHWWRLPNTISTLLMDTIKQLASQLPFVNGTTLTNGSAHVNGTTKPGTTHPFDPLTASEISLAVSIIQREYSSLALHFNTVTLKEPPKATMLAWLGDSSLPRPHRIADIVAVGRGSKVYDGLVDLQDEKITAWECVPGVQPLITVEDLQDVEKIIRKDERVIEQCGIVGIPRENMDQVYCGTCSCLYYP
jgi:Cu2+-containing amine oxidase